MIKNKIVVIHRAIQNFVWIPPGEFFMGDSSRKKRQKIILTEGFWLSDTVCTQALWYELMMGTFDSTSIPPDRPITKVSYYNIQRFFHLFNKGKYTSQKASLPTEAEWEYACKAGTDTKYNYGDIPDDNKMVCRGTQEFPLHVMCLPPNPWGLYEMHGNVWELCQDNYESYNITAEPKVNPIIIDKDSILKVIRGGSYISSIFSCQSHARSHTNISEDGFSIGFRIKLSP